MVLAFAHEGCERPEKNLHRNWLATNGKKRMESGAVPKNTQRPIVHARARERTNEPSRQRDKRTQQREGKGNISIKGIPRRRKKKRMRKINCDSQAMRKKEILSQTSRGIQEVKEGKKTLLTSLCITRRQAKTTVYCYGSGMKDNRTTIFFRSRNASGIVSCSSF